MGANDANANDVSLNLWNLTWKRSVDKTNTQFLFERWIKKIYLSMGKSDDTKVSFRQYCLNFKVPRHFDAS